MKCVACGLRNFSDASACRRCGGELRAGSSHPPPVGAATSSAPPAALPLPSSVAHELPSVVMGDELDVPVAGFALPALCCKCGAAGPLDDRRETLKELSAGMKVLAVVLAPFGLLLSALVVVFGTKRVPAAFPVCKPCGARWRNAKLLRVASYVAPILVGVLVAQSDAAGVLGGLLAWLVALVIVPWACRIWLVRPATVHASTIGARRARLRGISPVVLDAISRGPDPRMLDTSTWSVGTSSGWGWVPWVVAGTLVIPAFGVLAVLSLYGVRRYTEGARTVEATRELKRLGESAGRAFQRDGRLCGSAPHGVPRDLSAVEGGPYVSVPTDWRYGGEGVLTGFECLGFRIQGPQQFQYTYETTDTGFVAEARRPASSGAKTVVRITGSFDEHGVLVVGAPTLVRSPSLE